MAQVISTNIASLNAQRNLTKSQSALNTSLQRLSSGMRINSAKDDAAGLAISERFTAQIRGLNQAVRNANDGLSQLQTADGGINNISQLLDRARTLATQSASGAFTGDRSVLNSEFQSVISEIDRQAQAVGLDQAHTGFAHALQELAHARITARGLEVDFDDGLGRGLEPHAHGVKAEQHFGG